MKRILAAFFAAATMVTFTGCRRTSNEPPNGMTSYNFKEMNTDYIQLKPPAAGDKIAVIDTDFGEIRVVLYEQYAPNTVRNFIAKAEAGVYNNMPIKAVENDAYFLTGGREDEKGNYLGRESDDELVDNEYSVDLWPFRGALMSFSENKGYNSDARWFIVNNDAETLTKETINELKESANAREDETERDNMIAMFDAFYDYGGVFGLAGYYTVFGHTYLGLDVVEELTHIPSDENFQASDAVMIKSVTISEFKDGDATDKYPREPINHADGENSGAETSD